MPEHQQIQQSTESKTTFQKQATPIVQTPISNPMAIIQRARINPKSLTRADVMQLQRTIGNRAVGRLFSEIGLIPSTAKQSPPIQRQEIPEEEEPLQGKFESGPEKETCPSCMQRQEIPEEEEPLQGKLIEPIQRQEIPEEEKLLQGKFENKPEIACPSCFASPIVQRQEIPEEEEPLQGKFESIQRQEIPEEEEPLQTKRENNTGMPDNLKDGVESLSGIDMSDVRVHYNSDKSTEVGALVYTQGTNIHVAPGQERHLPHESWHVVQQAQGRVKPTMQLKDGIPFNDDEGLEHEADVMGAKALQTDDKISEGIIQKKTSNVINQKVYQKNGTSDVVIQRELAKDRLNVVGEDHPESNARRHQEINYTKKIIGGTANYWMEYQFTVNNEADWGDPKYLRLADRLKMIETSFTLKKQKAWQFNLESPEEKKHLEEKVLPALRKKFQTGVKLFEGLKSEIDEDRRLIAEGKSLFKEELATVDLEKLESQGRKLKESLTEGITKIDNYNIEEEKTNVELNSLLLYLYYIYNNIKDYGSKSINANSCDELPIQLQRSIKMNEAANQESNQLGVWKIGQAHVEDIKKTNADKLNYKLVDKVDFDYDFLVWDLNQPTP